MIRTGIAGWRRLSAAPWSPRFGPPPTEHMAVFLHSRALSTHEPRRLGSYRLRLTVFLCLGVAGIAATAAAQESGPPPPASAAAPASKAQTAPEDKSGATSADKAHAPKKQPKRILGLMPNYRAVSAGVIPPPPGPKEAFLIATENSFDYSAFAFVGVTSALAEWTDTHPQLGEGLTGYGRYYWRGFLDKTDGNYLVDFALPTVLHEDERYFARGEGRVWKRAVYAASRVLITPDYQGHDTFNAAEILGRGISQGLSAYYYPGPDRTLGALAVKFGYAVGRDALTNVFREFWPDISSHFHHHHRDGQPGL